MSTLEEAAQLRLDARQKQANEDKRLESIGAVTQGSQEIVAASKQLGDKLGNDITDGLERSTQKLAKSTDIDTLIAQVKEVQLAAMLGNSKPAIILTDKTDLGERITALGDKLDATVKSLDSSETDSQQLAALKDLSSAFGDFKQAVLADTKNEQKANKELLAAIKAIKVAPVVNVPESKITVPQSKIDLKPLQDTLKEYLYKPESDKLDLECYRAQDIDNTNKDMQYIGFINPTGNWYIIENDVKGDRLRYLFGLDGYEEAFSKAATYTYSLLNEAIDALPA